MEETNSIIILLSEAREMKERQVKELEFYRGEMKRLQIKMQMVQREIQVTELAIRIIERETTANSASIKT